MDDTKEKIEDEHFANGDLVIARLTGKRAIVVGELTPEPDEFTFGRKYLIEYEDGVRKRVFASFLDFAE